MFRSLTSCRNFLGAASVSSRKYFLPKRALSTINTDPAFLRNVAIIAHVDHGKTTLVDKLLQECGKHVNTERAMDSNEHEKERGITIMNTPGHADFGGEVERILSMVDGVVLLVDASEGPMSQTKFVLSKALAAEKKPIVVLNKIDRPSHRAEEVESDLFDLFCALTSNDDLLNYPVLYASAKQGWVVNSLSDVAKPDKCRSMAPLLDAILENIPAPGSKELLDKPFALSVNTISSDPHLGRIVTGKVERGQISLNSTVKVLNRDGKLIQPSTKVSKLFYLEGLQRVDVDHAHAGQIVSLAGSDIAGVTDTVCDIENETAVACPPISPPIIAMTFGPNDSPLSGKEGTKLTSSMIKDRLRKEVENNVTVSLRESSDPESLDVQGRGELQLGILIETLRREGFEMTVSPPKVLAVTGEDGVSREPIEEVTVDVDSELQGVVIEAMSNRKGSLTEFKDIGNRARLIFSVPSRGMMGFRHEVMTATRGNATVNSIFSHYDIVNKSDFSGLRKGKLVSMETGKATGYSLMAVEERGTLFIAPNEEVYEGMVIGENAKQGDLDVNPCKAKRLTNMRSTGAEEKVALSTPRKMTVEQIIAYMNEDEVVEVTPKSIRLRKRILDSGARARANKSLKKQ